MDYALVDSESRKKYFTEKGSYSAHDETGRLLVNDDMDIALLMLYGHILYAGTSYPYALSTNKADSPFPKKRLLIVSPDYFFRAYALNPENPMINLSIGLGYVHYGLKRQSENRQFHLMQGLSFLFRYYELRHRSPKVEERQEAHYNMARAYHMVGLAHLALPYYLKVLDEIQGSAVAGEDLVRDAVYNLQNIYAMGGNLAMAKFVTANWLSI
jgi:general transcription factor 3C polypeptide 3 (transcription factor C subunit 4)